MHRHLSTLFSLLFFSFYCLAHSVKGRIVSLESGEVITGAVVQVEGTAYRAISGLDGSFTIKHIPEGNYKMVISMVGYLAEKASLEVTEKMDLVEIGLKTSRMELDGVIITGAKEKNGDAGARNMERVAPQVMNIVSARAMEISPDVTVANVIQRVSGVSIERNSNGDGQYAIVRGMDKRYNYTLVNGIKIPSPDNKYRYVPLDMFPSDLLDRLEVYKSLTPSMEGDAIGGVVNMVMKNAPSHRLINVNLAANYSELFMNRDFMSYDAGDINKKSPYELHGGEAYHATPADFPAASSTYTLKKPLPGIIGGLAYGDRFLNDKLGVIVAANIQNTYRGSNSLNFSSDVVDTLKGVSITSMSERKFSEEQLRYGIHTKLDYRFSKRTTLSLYSAYIDLTNTQIRDAVSTNVTGSQYVPEQGKAELSYSTRSRKTIQHIWNNTLQGNHQLNKNLLLDWTAVYSKASSQQPDNTTISLDGIEDNFQRTRTTIDHNGSSRRWDHNTDQDLAGYLNLTWKKSLGRIPVEWKLGGLYRDKKRVNFANEYTLFPADRNALYGKDFTSYDQIRWTVQNPEGSVASGLTYDASEKIGAGFLQFKADMKKLEVTGGVRMEHTDQGYSMKFPIGEDNPTDHQVYTDVLPSLNIKYMPFSKTNVRASYFRSINRPGFSEINPTPLVQEEYTEKGDPNLKHAVADNFDLRYELFPRPSEQFMVGVFYKHITDPIEFTVQVPPTDTHNNTYYMPGNFGNANNYGAEIDYTRYFNKFGIKANYTYTNSRITTLKSKRIRNSAGDLETIKVDQTRPLYGQSAHVANISLLYKDVRKGWEVQLANGYTGPRINTVAQFVDVDIWQKGFIQMDFSAEKSFKNHLTIFAKANNLLDTPATLFIKNQSTKNSKVPMQDLSGQTLIRRDYYERSYTLGARFKF